MRRILLPELFIPGLVILLFINIIGSCKNELPDVTKMRKVCFDNEILPLFQSNCSISGCHTSGSELPLDSYTSILQAVEPGNPDNSQAYQAIIAKWGEVMPPDRPISQEARTLIRIWIQQGAENTVCNSAQLKSANNVPEVLPVEIKTSSDTNPQ